MTDQEYIQLVQGSTVFQRLNEDMQERILKAEGADRERYIQIFTVERNGILAAQKELVESNNAVVKKFKTEIKTIQRDKLRDDEARSSKEDMQQSEALLKELDGVGADHEVNQ